MEDNYLLTLTDKQQKMLSDALTAKAAILTQTENLYVAQLLQELCWDVCHASHKRPWWRKGGRWELKITGSQRDSMYYALLTTVEYQKDSDTSKLLNSLLLSIYRACPLKQKEPSER